MTKAGTSKVARARRAQLFVEAYLQNGGNATQAAVAAGYKAGRAAEQAGFRLSKDVVVSAELKKRAAEVAATAELKTEAVIGVLRCLVQARAVDALTKHQRAQLPALTPDLEVAIVGFKFDSKGKLREVKFADKSSAVEKAMQHLRMFDEENAQKGDVIRQFMDAISGHSRALPTRRQSEEEESST